MTELMLYDYWRSSAAYRVRIALKVKGVHYTSIPVHLAKGEQHAAAYKALNPQAAVPLLVAGSARLTQSLAIIEYLEERYPAPPLLPHSAEERAMARAMAQVVASDIHPLNNLRVMQYLTEPLGIGADARNEWYEHWIRRGLAALEALARESSRGRFCIGDHATVADCCLVPQLYNARRYQVPLDAYPTLVSIDAHCRSLQAFQDAAPEKQGDAE